MSRKYFEAFESRSDFVPDTLADQPPGSFPSVTVKQMLPFEYQSSQIGKIFAKNGDGATLIIGAITLISTITSGAFVTGALGMGWYLTFLLPTLAIAVLLAIGIWTRDPEGYSPRTFLGMNVLISLISGIFVLAGTALAVLGAAKVLVFA